jgi:diaminohydroxyphosphoribosylaminopyrimidine deaminase/5-amino-6-(5-phosphoribosylamino)uracil reductase
MLILWRKGMSVQSSVHIKSAIELAMGVSREAIRPNPFVGAIVINDVGAIVGKGFHKKYGEAHAEVFAIREATASGADLSTCILYVTLEPCSHTGKTPPCTDLIISSGIRKVVVGSKDPNPLVNGIGILREAGVEVVLEESQEALELNAEFFVNQRFKRPYVRAKAAITSDGFMARENGDSKWISSPESRAWAHEYCRAQVDAILTTARTVLADDAKLNVRTAAGEKECTAIVIDRELDLLKNNKLSIHYPRSSSRLYLVTDRSVFSETDLEWMRIDGKFEKGMIDVNLLFEKLYKEHQIYSVLVEAGPRLINHLLELGLIDELVIFRSITSFNNGSDRYRLNLSPVSGMEKKEVTLDGSDQVMIFSRSQ